MQTSLFDFSLTTKQISLHVQPPIETALCSPLKVATAHSIYDPLRQALEQ